LLVALAGAPELPLQFNRRARNANAANAPAAGSTPESTAEAVPAETTPAKSSSGTPQVTAQPVPVATTNPAPDPNATMKPGLDETQGALAKGPYAMGVREATPIVDSPIYARGELGSPGEVVPRGFLQVLTYGAATPIPADHSGRLELADWLTDPRNPLTARVFVNRVWQHLLGEGLVRTADNFGKTGALPANQELLDYLAVRFVAEGWSVKQLIRSIVVSRVYQLSSAIDEHNYTVDPGNTLVWRATPRRLDAEQIRDSILVASGRLDLAPPHGSLVADLGNGYIGRTLKDHQFQVESAKRSVFLPIVRDLVPESLSLFDFAEPSLVVARRDSTNVPAQALFLMNNAFVLQESEAAAKRLLALTESDEGRIDAAFRTVFARPATDAERQRIGEFLRHQLASLPAAEAANAATPTETAWALVVQALLASAEFRYLQ
jgi:hypothetical protein